jgi:hypothetical protein
MTPQPTWQIEVRQGGLQKYRVIRGRDPAEKRFGQQDGKSAKGAAAETL